MIVVIEPYNAHQHKELLKSMFRLRSRIFRDRLSWDVHVDKGIERDKYDDEGPVYIIYTDRLGKAAKGSLRLLPTTGPTLLADVFGDTLPDAAHLTAPSIWECTRFCVDASLLNRSGGESLLSVSGTLMAALGEVALKAGIQSILGNFDPVMLRMYRRLGCDVEVLGSTNRYGAPIYRGLFPVSRDILRRVKDLADARAASPAKASTRAQRQRRLTGVGSPLAAV